MKKIIALISAVAMTAALLAGCASKPAATTAAAKAEAAAPTKVVFGTNAEFAPFEFINPNGVIGEYDGIDMAIAKKIGEMNNVEVEISNLEFDSLLVALQNGQIDAVIAGMTVTEERAQAVDFTTPYYQATQVMIVKEGSDIKKATDMADKKIAVVQGYTGEVCVSDLGYDYEAFKKGTECIMELVNGKCDVVVIDSATAKQYVADNKGLVIVEDGETFEAEEYAIAVAKDHKDLLDMMNSAIEKLLADGTISSISAEYIDASN